MNQYRVVMECRIRKLVIVEAENAAEAAEKAEAVEWIDEQEIEMIDWEIESGVEVDE